MKKLVFCFDGTWNKIDGEYTTNVARIAQSISRFDTKKNPQIVHYDEGVGTTFTARWSGGIFGHGLRENILEAYHFLVLNYDPGDEIFVFGFSRGAFTARSFVGLIRNCGIMSRRSLSHIRAAIELYNNRSTDSTPNSERARQFRFEHCAQLCLPGDLDWRIKAHPTWKASDVTELKIKFLGVWDTVGALGIPRHLKLLAWLTSSKYGFHDTQLSAFVERAHHAVSADERRKTFEPGLWSNLGDLNDQTRGKPKYEQQIFPGTHSAVGGGGPVRGLSDAALEWIFAAAKQQGLKFDLDKDSPIFSMRPDHKAELFNETGKSGWSFKDRVMGMGLADRRFEGIDRSSLHKTLARRAQEKADALPERKEYRPASLKDFWTVLLQMDAGDKTPDDVETKGLWDPRALRAPDRVRPYVIQPGDTLSKIAQQEMEGKNDQAILFLHNEKIGRLYDPDEIYAGTEIEIPIYPIKAENSGTAPS